jgi:hypothetical protein
MRKSLVAHLRGYVIAIFEDVRPTYRCDRDWRRDKSRLLHELEVNGSRVLLIDLPALAKHLDKCLSNCLYTPSGCYLGSLQSKRVQVPAFLRDLYLQIFDSSGKLLDDASIAAVKDLRQLLNGAKKIKVSCSVRGIRNEVKNFLLIENGIRRPSLNWDGDDLHGENERVLSFTDWTDKAQPRHDFGTLFGEPDEPSEVSFDEASVLSAVADRISVAFGDLHEESPFERPRHGPGVVSDLKKSQSKYQFLDWPRKLDLVFPHDLYATTDLGVEAYFSGHEYPMRNREVPSRLIAVPKDPTKPRLIAAEPSQHQWIQQLVWNQLELRLQQTLLRTCVLFRDQGNNQNFALKGSRDGSLATIDLSSASDRLSCAVVERFFRENSTILDRLHACRTRWLEVDIHGVHQMVNLKKFASQGNACTFPVQSIVYAGVAIAAVLISKEWRATPANFTKAAKMVTVFGDDIVVPNTACRTAIRLLGFLGLKVNLAKTYWNGQFRESCGVEAFRGSDVTPARLLTPSSRASSGSLPSLIQQANNFWVKGLWHTAKWLDATFARYENRIPVVSVRSNAAGVVSFCGQKTDHLKSRESADLHRTEIKVLVPHVKELRADMPGNNRLFQWFIEEPAPDLDWESGVVEKTVADMRPGWVSRDYILPFVKANGKPLRNEWICIK